MSEEPKSLEIPSWLQKWKSKEMAQTWVVGVRSEQKLVRLFCPDCLDKVKEAMPDEET